MTRRAYLSARAKASVVRRQEYLCAECAHDLDALVVEFDHILPLALGGTNDIENFQALCRPCHLGKTGTDITRISKADRQALRTGQQKLRALRKQEGRPFFQSRPMGWRGIAGLKGRS